MFERMVYNSLIESQLSHHLRRKRHSLQLYHNKSSELQVIEKHIDIVVITIHFKVYLSTDK